MRSGTVRFLCFLSCFILDVRVKADASVSLPERMNSVQFPAGCLQNERPCAVKTRENEKIILQSGERKTVLGEESVALIDEKSEVVLISGLLWVESREPVWVKTIFGEIVGKGEYWVKKDDERVTAGVSKGEVRMIPSSNNVSLLVKRGMQNWIGKIDRSGESETGIPQPVILAEHLRIWAALSGTEKRKFKNHAREFILQWHKAVRTLSHKQKGMVERRVASVNDKRQRRKVRMDQLRKRESAVRDLFKQRNHLY